MSSGSKWTRPTSVVLPTVWRRCQGRLPMKDGRRPRFVVQDAPPELDDAVISHMMTHFLRDELVCSRLGLLSDEAALRDMDRLWRAMLEQRAALVALVEDGDGVARRVAGVNITSPFLLSDRNKKYELESAATRKIFDAYDYLMSLVQPDVFTRYGVDRYLTAFGLSVDPEFRGQGLGEELLKARWDLGRALHLPLTVTWFSGIASQKIAERVGFETLCEVAYADYIDPVFINDVSPTMKIMAARIT